jgi:phytoene dehydrogenase-like protein
LCPARRRAGASATTRCCPGATVATSAITRSSKRSKTTSIGRLDQLFPGTAARICYRESATPLSHSRFTRASDGSGYGLAATPDQFLDKRPGYRGPIEGLYLCGASTRAGHGMAGAMMGGCQGRPAHPSSRRSSLNVGGRGYRQNLSVAVVPIEIQPSCSG